MQSNCLVLCWGYNITALIEALEDEEVAQEAVAALSHTLLMFDAFHDVKEKADAGNPYAEKVLKSWADGEWFTSRRAYRIKLLSACSKCRAKPILTTCLPRPMPGPGRISRCMPRRC